jgi:hypothetical protein
MLSIYTHMALKQMADAVFIGAVWYFGTRGNVGFLGMKRILPLCIGLFYHLNIHEGDANAFFSKAMSVLKVEYPDTMDETKTRVKIGGLLDPRLGTIGILSLSPRLRRPNTEMSDLRRRNVRVSRTLWSYRTRETCLSYRLIYFNYLAHARLH